MELNPLWEIPGTAENTLIGTGLGKPEQGFPRVNE